MPKNRKAYFRARRAAQRSCAVAYLGGKCSDCPETQERLLEFDHLRDKSYNVAKLLGGRWERVQEELDKCELRCLACHMLKDGRLERDRWGDFSRQKTSVSTPSAQT